jgi:hypothetical protein
LPVCTGGSPGHHAHGPSGLFSGHRARLHSAASGRRAVPARSLLPAHSCDCDAERQRAPATTFVRLFMSCSFAHAPLRGVGEASTQASDCYRSQESNVRAGHVDLPSLPALHIGLLPPRRCAPLTERDLGRLHARAAAASPAVPFVRGTSRRHAIRIRVSSARRSSGIDGSVARHRRPLMMTQCPSSVISGPLIRRSQRRRSPGRSAAR